MKTKFFICILFVVALMVLSACDATPTSTLTPTPLFTKTQTITEIPRPTATLQPSYTAFSPSPTTTRTPSLTPTLTLTATMTPHPVFADFQVEYSEYTYYGMLIGFRIPGIKENYRLTVDGIDYPCTLNDKSPDHLYCHGPQLEKGRSVKLVFLPLKGDNTPLYETTYIIAPMSTATLDPQALATAADGDKCAVRGIHVTCETEYRNNGEGGYCIVATCVDLCGYYYSVHTCPEGSENWGIYPMTGTPPLPGNR